MNVFKKIIVRYVDAQGRQVRKDTPGAEKVQEFSTKYYGRVPGNPRLVPLATNKTAAELMLAQLVRQAEMEEAGIVDPFAAHRRRPLAEHLADYKNELAARDNTPAYVNLAIARLETVFDGCGFVLLADLSASRVLDFLARLRQERRPLPPLEPGKESFTRAELAAALGVKPTSIHELICRHQLPATGRRQARRFPRQTVEFLRERLRRGKSVQTTNYYLSHLKSFCRWLVKDRRSGDNPLAHLDAGNSDVDRRHDRRELEAEELRQLLAATKASGRGSRGLTGPDRFHLYATACGTGFRASALASLTPESFDLGARPTATLPARSNKSRKTKVQPLPPDVADLLRGYLADKPAGVRVWPGTWHTRAADMLRLDLEAVGIPYAVDGPDGPLYADFHALRHTYLTLGGRAGIDLRTLQELAGHSSSRLTERYSHRRLYDLQGAVEKLPSFLPDEGPSAAQTLRATGTEGTFSCSPVAHAADSEQEDVIPIETKARADTRNAAGPNPCNSQELRPHELE